jgi:SAM-dependent MidA family methyltransferase
MDLALYGPDGFYTRGEAPADHFRTSTHASPLFAEALLRLAARAGLRAVVDVGAGGGELLRQMHRLDPDLTLFGVDVRPRPPGLPAPVRWLRDVPAVESALLVANEWLDNVPLDVVTRTPDGLRAVLVDQDGHERLGPEPDQDDLCWLARWWPDIEAGGRAEVGHPRDAAWARAVGRLRSGVALAVDYAHERASRPATGTLTGYRSGRRVPPVPDGSCDLTAHVALDSCADAGRQAGADQTLLLTQREALHQLGVAGARPPHGLARTDPLAYLRGLERAGQAAELTDPAGLGGFCWLVQAVGVPLPLTAPHRD